MTSFDSCINKQKELVAIFSQCATPEARYEKIIELGHKLGHLDPQYKGQENLVKGCQSKLYLRSYLEDEVIVFEAESDALFSAGLAFLLVKAYSQEPPEAILKCPPTFIEEIGLTDSLSPGRSNGLYSVHLRMKQDALKFYMQLNPKS